MLAEVGIDSLEGLEECQPSYGVRLFGDDGASLSLSYDDEFARGEPAGYVCSRRSFDEMLVQHAIRNGVTFWPHTRVDELVREGEIVRGVRATRLQSLSGEDDSSERYPRSETLLAPIVIGADGAYSVVARELRIPQFDERHYYSGIRAYFRNVGFDDPMHHAEIHYLDEAAPGYFWISPLPDGRANVGVGMLSSSIKERRLQLKDVLIDALDHPHLRDRFKDADMEGVTKAWGLPLGSRPRKMAGDGWMLVGDAASLVDPFAGEGIASALLSGKLAGEAAVRARQRDSYSSSTLQDYPDRLMKSLRGQFRLSRAMQRLGRRRRILNAVIRKGGKSEDLTRVMTGMFDHQSSRTKLLSPLFYVRVLMA